MRWFSALFGLVLSLPLAAAQPEALHPVKASLIAETKGFQGATGTADVMFVFVTGSNGYHFSNFGFLIDGSIDY